MKTEIVKPELKVEINHKITQQDVIELVAYKRTEQINQEITNLKEKRSKIETKIKEVKEKLKISLEKEIPKLLTPLMAIIKEQINFVIEFGSIPSIYIKKENDRNGSIFLTLNTESFPKISFEKYNKLQEESQEISKTISTLERDIYQIKNDKNSIKNAITEQMLLETDEGKDLLSLVENSYAKLFPKALK